MDPAKGAGVTDLLKSPKLAGAVSTGALVLMLLGWVFDLAQRVAHLEGRAQFFHGAPTSAESQK